MTETDLSDFLRARLDEDEQAANKYKGEPWEHPGGPSEIVATTESDYPCLRIDKPRVLAEVDAKRRIVDEPVGVEGWLLMQWEAARTEHARVLRLLALPYADHSDYRQEWKP